MSQLQTAKLLDLFTYLHKVSPNNIVYMTENIIFFYTEDMVLGDLFKKNIQIFLKSAGCLLRTPALLKIISLFKLRICEEHTISLLCGEIQNILCHSVIIRKFLCLC